MADVRKQRDRLRSIVKQFSDVSVLVLADLVADEFVYGEISRVSREAPVLILKHRETKVVPGGGANAIMNLAELGVNVMPVGVVGDDEAGRLLLQAFKAKKIVTGGIFKVKNRMTTTKTRILAYMPHSARQQVVRVDREPAEITEHDSSLLDLINAAREFAPATDAMLVSDYGYGAATPRLLTFIKSNGCLKDKPITLDSRYRMLEFEGVYAATPNENEVEAALNVKIGNDRKKLLDAGRTLMTSMKLESLVITRGSDGMVAFEGKEKPVEIPIHGSDEVADVTGAGDTVIATYTAAIAAGADTVTAASIANIAGGIVVMKRGTATVSQKELHAAIEHSVEPKR
jgi:D-glycero-beta-D-manno-heptose-7-phosphate kinase